MNSKQIFVAHHCKIKSPLLEKSLKEKKYTIVKKNCQGVKILRHIFREKPAICIIKSIYKDLTGLEIIKEAYLKNCKTKFIIVFNEVSEIDVILAKKFNVSGCISTKDSVVGVLTCINKVHNNEHHFSNAILKQIDRKKLNNYKDFTDFQRKIIAFIGFYNSPERLAKKLNVAISKVEQEIKTLKFKLRLPNDQPLHLWAVNNTNFVETLALT